MQSIPAGKMNKAPQNQRIPVACDEESVLEKRAPQSSTSSRNISSSSNHTALDLTESDRIEVDLKSNLRFMQLLQIKSEFPEVSDNCPEDVDKYVDHMEFCDEFPCLQLLRRHPENHQNDVVS